LYYVKEKFNEGEITSPLQISVQTREESLWVVK